MLIFSESKPVLVVDIGNTNTICSIYQNGEAIWTARLQTERDRTSDEYYGRLCSLLQCIPSTVDISASENVSVKTERQSLPVLFSQIPFVALGSVVPELTRVWKHMIQKYASAQVVEIDGLSKLGMQLKVTNPEMVGSDLIANAYAAWKKYDQSAIVIDLGTATTIQVISRSGIFEGAIIAPGMKTGAANLFAKAAQLNELELIPPSSLLGSNTKDAVLSGIVYGHAFMLEGYITKLKKQYFDHSPLLTIITGGMAALVKPYIPSADIVDKSLTLDGFYLAFKALVQE